MSATAMLSQKSDVVTGLQIIIITI